MSTSTKLKAIDRAIEEMQNLQCVHFEMPNSTDKFISETISRLLKEKCYLEDKLNQEGNIAKRYMKELKKLFN